MNLDTNVYVLAVNCKLVIGTLICCHHLPYSYCLCLKLMSPKLTLYVITEKYTVLTLYTVYTVGRLLTLYSI